MTNMLQKKKTYLKELGIQIYERKTAQPAAIATLTLDTSTEGHDTLRTAIANCMTCDLHKTRTQTVYGVGNLNADLMLIGEAPGFYEDQQGEPFVGRAGQLLNAMLQAIGFERNQVFIANILKCRPPENRDPLPEEIACCTPFLEKQINLIQPKLILALGRIAAQFLLDNKISLTQLRGQVYHYGMLKTPLLVTYHPAYLLRNPKDKAKAFLDLQLAAQQLLSLAATT